MEKTLILIKPDAVERKLIGKIISLYEERELKVIAMRMLRADQERVMRHYEEHIGRSYFDNLMNYITRSPLVALVLEGENAIALVREINGKTDPAEAAEGTIRRLYGQTKTFNTVHASDSKESAAREIAIWFS
ncbi:nucleoside-diphosphate kinase [Proteiniclasticum sp. SCR006]|uniref:Nucleoside diphosphate kinase n=1 Tax=Proteiniclasticum aestuarii TaxID=2817862 RepID=A0A939KM24_9CLOT|nr:nucleoside-diphosphate kinase [Proteiniclasticum aestuarii]MBO1266250.1 nucleoside-diphosphate kinase [Proteiniclasticum aestuarii]